MTLDKNGKSTFTQLAPPVPGQAYGASQSFQTFFKHNVGNPGGMNGNPAAVFTKCAFSLGNSLESVDDLIPYSFFGFYLLMIDPSLISMRHRSNYGHMLFLTPPMTFTGFKHRTCGLQAL